MSDEHDATVGHSIPDRHHPDRFYEITWTKDDPGNVTITPVAPQTYGEITDAELALDYLGTRFMINALCDAIGITPPP